MPRIDREAVREVLRNHYFDHHTAMHLSRERVKVYDPDKGKVDEVPPILDPSHKCNDCKHMTQAGEPGSGREFLQMHHDMIRVFRYLLEKNGIPFGVKWKEKKGKTSQSEWEYDRSGDSSYAPVALWNLDDHARLPEEIRSLFSYADRTYLEEVFEGVKARVAIKPGGRDEDPIDELGQFIERGVKEGEPEGHGFHNTVHEYLASRERKTATGAEMNKLRNSLFNDYFWSLHLWIDGQYGRLVENLGEKFETGPQAPGDPMESMKHQTHTRILAHKTANP